ncbi:unnamed protein product [Orchesella dallaii]|uniref:Uncharacterized protein n=1 Tax=Orchesella dallaii TaxID=48710 RepID=A0ABP1QB65_9HEXA
MYIKTFANAGVQDTKEENETITSITKSRTAKPDNDFTVDPDGIACHIPKMNPFDSSIIHLIQEPEIVHCGKKFPKLFKSTLTSSIVPLISEKDFENILLRSCCYRTVTRSDVEDEKEPENEDWPDDKFQFSDTCYPISLSNATLVPKEHEYVAIICEQVMADVDVSNATLTKIVDMHAFVNLKPSVEERVNSIHDSVPIGETVNLLVLGMDGVSHMNFLRTMPKSYAYIKNELNAVEMQGFNKIGDNTYPNLIAALTSKNENEINSTCNVQDGFDSCPFIWKTFSEHGYRTAFGEDSTWMGGFNYLKKGFKKPPTDYYLRPFGIAAEEHIAHHKELNANLCYGPRLSMEVLLDYVQKFAYTMGKDKRYFQFIWSTSLTHDELNYGRLGDKHLLSTLEWLHTGGYLNQTVLILMSDHGLRWGDIVEYPQGQLEERMPFLFFVVPPWFKAKYSRAYENLQGNQERLTTPFDLYETLNDFITLEHITAEEIEYRETDLEISEEQASLPRGISQFLPIPLSRKCKSAGIEDHYCVCHNHKVISSNNTIVKQAASYAVFFINSLVSTYPKCAFLSLSTVKSAQVVDKGFLEEEEYQIIFKTTPGDASFEASVIRHQNGVWTISGTIGRTNLYGNQSHCVDNRDVKLYCYCTNFL